MFLACQTYFSFRYGLLSVKELVQQAHALGLSWLGLTDLNSASAWFDFTRLCRQHGIRPVVGLAFRPQENEHTTGPQVGATPKWADTTLYWAWAREPAGFQEINRLLTERSVEGFALPRDPIDRLAHCVVAYPLHNLPRRALRAHEYVAIQNEHEANYLHPASRKRFGDHTAGQLRAKALALPPIVLRDAQDHQYHRALRAIDRNVFVGGVPEAALCPPDAYLHPPEAWQWKFQHLPEALVNAERVAQACTAELALDTNKNKRTYTATRADDLAFLRMLAEQGLQKRYRGFGQAIREQALTRMRKELRVIAELELCAYFLITWDFVNYARSRGYKHVGRGSGANSIVAYCIGLTDVDPIELDLYFERFINPHRATPPDFDIDFSWDERNEIIQYIFRRWGREHVALMAAYVTMQPRALLRYLGKAFAVEDEKIDKWVGDPHSLYKPSQRHYKSIEKAVPEPEVLTTRNTVGKQFFKPRYQADEELLATILDYSQRLLNFPDHLSIHAGGILITEEPITRYTPLQMMPKGFPVTHWDMYVAEDNGFYKYDVLSQRGLGHIKTAVQLILENRGEVVDIHDVNRFKTDERCNELLRTGETVGCFYVESPAMRQLLRKLDCADYPTLVAASSIIRPGVSASGMMKAYIERHARANGRDIGNAHDRRGQHATTRDPRDMEYLHPKLAELLADTYGVMVYQEDVIKVCHHFAGMELNDADLLRRAMSGKYRSSKAFAEIQDKFFASCASRGIEPDIAKELWRQIQSFAGYSFSKAHSASFAVESYQSLYLKAYYPLEFYCAVINNFGGFYSTEFYVHAARLHGARIEPPCLNHSYALTSLSGQTLWLGLGLVKGLEQKTIQAVVEDRARNGPFASLADLLDRVPIGPSQLDKLIDVGALRFTGLPRAALHRQAIGFGQQRAYAQLLFTAEDRHTSPAAIVTLPADAPLAIAWQEVEYLGFPTQDPFLLLADADDAHNGTIAAADMLRYLGKRVSIVGYFICRKRVRTAPKNPRKERQDMGFGHFLDRHGTYFDTTHFPQAYASYPFRGRGFYRLTGKVVDDFGHPSVEITEMQPLRTRPKPAGGA